MSPNGQPAAIDAAAIPETLRQRAQWVCWKYVRKGKKKPDKVPFNPNTRGPAKSTDPSSWASFDKAIEVFRRGGYAGIGFVFTENDPFTGIDLDDCIDEHGDMVPSAAAIVAELNSYTEISPSGGGVKIFIVGVKPPGAKCKSKRIEGFKQTEVYSQERFFTVTGRHYAGTPLSVESRHAQLDALCLQLWPPKQPRPTTAAPASGGFDGDDDALVQRAGSAKNGPAFKHLWAGDTSGHADDRSAADLALCNLFAFWTGKDPARMDRLFRRSGLYRDKWDERRGDRTYGQMTIEKAIAGCADTYAPGRRRSSRANVGAPSPERATPFEQSREDMPDAHAEPAAPRRSSEVVVGSPPPGEQRPAVLGDGQRALTDLGNAERLIARFGEKVRYCQQNGQWYIWDAGRWGVDRSREIDSMAADSARGIRNEAIATVGTHDPGALLNWAKTSESRQRLEAAVAVARSIRAVAVTLQQFDADPWKLNVLNGTIDLRTGRLHPARREDLFTQQAPVIFDPQATCPRFDAFMARIMAGNTPRVEFLLRWFGHCLTGDITEQYLPILIGPGGNGKSVLVDTVRGIMGDYAGIAAPSLLLDSNFQDHPTEIAELKGKRLTVASENEGGQSFKLQLVKRLTGDGGLKGRFMRQDFFEFQRTNKTVLVTNTTPRVRENSEAAWRRLLLVLFDVIIPEPERDAHLLDKLTMERPGILRRLLEGCLAWQSGGLNPPLSVIAASKAYRQRESSLERFYSECCVVEPGASETWRDLSNAYIAWAKQAGVACAGENDQRAFFDGHGHPSKTIRIGDSTSKHRIGLRLRHPPGGQT